MALSLSETALLVNSALRGSGVRAMRKINGCCIEECAGCAGFSEIGAYFAKKGG